MSLQCLGLSFPPRRSIHLQTPGLASKYLLTNLGGFFLCILCSQPRARAMYLRIQQELGRYRNLKSKPQWERLRNLELIPCRIRIIQEYPIGEVTEAVCGAGGSPKLGATYMYSSCPIPHPHENNKTKSLQNDKPWDECGSTRQSLLHQTMKAVVQDSPVEKRPVGAIHALASRFLTHLNPQPPSVAFIGPFPFSFGASLLPSFLPCSALYPFSPWARFVSLFPGFGFLACFLSSFLSSRGL